MSGEARAPTDVEDPTHAAPTDEDGLATLAAAEPDPTPEPRTRFHVDEKTGEFTSGPETPRQRLAREALEREVAFGNELDKAMKTDWSIGSLRGEQLTELVRGKLETAKDDIAALQKHIKDSRLVPETAGIAAVVVNLARVWRIAHDLEASGKHLKDPKAH